jgi:hypothetical protein
MDSIILRPKKSKELRLLFMSVVFVAAGIWMVKRGEALGWLPISFLGLCSLVFLVTVLPNASYLELHREGFTQVTMFKSATFRWQDVSEFSVGRVGLNKMVMLDFVPAWRNSSKLKMVAKSMSGHDGALPDTYGLSAEELVALLNEWKSKSRT